jgi:hypothetical protein
MPRKPTKTPPPSPRQLVAELDSLLAAVDASEIPEPSRSNIKFVLSKYRAPAADTLAFIEKEKLEIAKLADIPGALREFMLQDLSDYANETDPEERRRTKDRIYKVLTAKVVGEESAQDKKRRAREILTVAGHERSHPNFDKYKGKVP